MPRLVTIGENRIQKKRRHFVEIKKKDFFFNLYLHCDVCEHSGRTVFFFVFRRKKNHMNARRETREK